MNNRWTENDIALLKDLSSSNKNINDMCLLLNRSRSSVSNKLIRLGLTHNKTIHDWTPEQIKFLEENYENLEKEYITNYIGKKWGNIRQKARSLNLRRSTEINRSIPRNRLSALLNDTNESFYWIGFILADGTVTNDSIQIEVSKNDENHLLQINNYLKNDIVLYRRRNTVTISINDRINIKQIKEKFDIKQKKTYNPPDYSNAEFSQNNLLSLIVGFIDGDGNISKRKNGGTQLTVENHASWKEFHIFIEKFIYSYFEEELLKNHQRFNNRGYSLITISKSKIVKLLYDEIKKLNLQYMRRKKHKRYFRSLMVYWRNL
jgi:hypothetical protein